MNYTDQEILFAMFILKANHWNWETISHHHDETLICGMAGMVYADLFADRGEHGKFSHRKALLEIIDLLRNVETMDRGSVLKIDRWIEESNDLLEDK